MHRLLQLRTARPGWPLLSLLLLLACQAPEDKQPDGLLSEDRMADILTQVHLAEARTSRLSLSASDSSRIAYKHIENEIFRRMSVDTAVYTRSFVFYSSHPKYLERIYQQVVDQLKKKTGQADTLRKS